MQVHGGSLAPCPSVTPPEKWGWWVLPWGCYALVEGCTQTTCRSDAPDSVLPAAPRPSVVGSSHFVLQNLNSKKNMEKTQGVRKGLMLQVK